VGQTLFNRLLISVGLAVMITIGGAVIAELLIQASDRFGWPLLLGAGAGVTVMLFVLDTITSAFAPQQ
jgi:hypothetical protein